MSAGLIVAACLGLLSGLFVPKRWKFAVMTFYVVGLVVSSTYQVFV